MARSIWNGTIKFALIAVPIKVHSATEDRTVHFHQVHDKDGARIKQKRICSKEDKEVPYKQVAKGYEVKGGEYVLLSQDEIDAASGPGAHVIELEEFVCQAEIDPVFYNRTYYLGAGEDAADAYRLLHDALGRSDRAGIGRWVFHNREYLVAVRSLDGVLALHTMRFADELGPRRSSTCPRPSRAPSKREVEMAGALVKSLHDGFDPKAFKDTYRAAGPRPDRPQGQGRGARAPRARASPRRSGDLMAALEASLRDTSRRRQGQELHGPRRCGAVR